MRSLLDDRVHNPWSPRGRFTSLIGAVVLVMSAASLAIPHQAVAAAAPAGSAMTMSGSKGSMGDFSNLKVTVGQTQNLINQSVTVSWTGGQPSTTAVPGAAGSNFLQIMECWSPNTATQPDRTQCEFGVGWDAPSGGQTPNLVIESRAVNPPASRGGQDTPYDPQETYTPLPGDSGHAYVPFQSATGKTISGFAAERTNDFFGYQNSNEVDGGLTRADGTGQVFFQMRNAVQASGLGCGATTTIGTTTEQPACWLVVVPRGSTEVDGTQLTGSSIPWLRSSPLSASNWASRIVFPLTFQPVGSVCATGVAQQLTTGSEMVNEAFTNWQTGLCRNTGSVYSYLQSPDQIARNALTSTTPGAVFLDRPLAPDQAPANEPPVYAPIALSGLAIAFNIQVIPANSASAAVEAQRGERVVNLTLNARLVAKLLTNSYRSGTALASNPAVKNNPYDLTADPEFLKLNPEFAQYNDSIGTVIEPEADSDAAYQLWNWIASDKDALDFINGAPDNFSGMTVNPAFKGMQLSTLTTYPKSDSYCVTTSPPLPTGAPPLCTVAEFGYANDLHADALDVALGNPQTFTAYTPNNALGAQQIWAATPREPDGNVVLLSITDTATASRYGLPTASLVNASGSPVAPTTCTDLCTTNDAALLAAKDAMPPSSVPGVLSSNPQATAKNAYPLTMLTYAATAPAALTPAQGKVYADMIRYAVQQGQVSGTAPGDLPAGYTPLPPDLVKQAQDAADTIQKDAGKPVNAPPGSPQAISTLTGQVVPPGTTGTGSPTSLGSSGSGSGVPGSGSGSPSSSLSGNSGLPGGPGGTTPAVTGAQGAGNKKSLNSPPQNVAANAPTGPTQSFPVSLVRLVMLIVVIVGGAAAFAGPSLLGVSMRLRR